MVIVKTVVSHMTTTSEKVLQETLQFRKALPELLKTHPGKWVVFLGGSVKSFHDDERSAYESALKEFGAEAGYVIGPVVEQAATPVTTAVMFGLSYA